VPFPAATLWLAGATDRLKSGAATAPVLIAKFWVVHWAKPKEAAPINWLLPQTTPALLGSGVAPE
jgi:hypothetical protein